MLAVPPLRQVLWRPGKPEPCPLRRVVFRVPAAIHLTRAHLACCVLLARQCFIRVHDRQPRALWRRSGLLVGLRLLVLAPDRWHQGDRRLMGQQQSRRAGPVCGYLAVGHADKLAPDSDAGARIFATRKPDLVPAPRLLRAGQYSRKSASRGASWWAWCRAARASTRPS